MYFKQDACPLQAAADIQYCAAQGMDHRQCCMNNGVGTTLAGGKVRIRWNLLDQVSEASGSVPADFGS